ncbi:hypothetical protein PMIN04_006796 [Paraphaeosphaeria minitans]
MVFLARACVTSSTWLAASQYGQTQARATPGRSLGEASPQPWQRSLRRNSFTMVTMRAGVVAARCARDGASASSRLQTSAAFDRPELGTRNLVAPRDLTRTLDDRRIHRPGPGTRKAILDVSGHPSLLIFPFIVRPPMSR